MRLLVTGAAGLVGGAIVRRAIESGHQVVRVWHATQPETLAGTQDLHVDLEDPAAVGRLPLHVDAVLHAAARIPAGEWTDEAAAAANLRADAALLEHYSGPGFSGRWVLVSTVALEHPHASAGAYAQAKAEAEDRLEDALPGRARSIRISSPYGPGMRHQNVLRRFISAALSGQPITLLGSGRRTQDFVHADDVAEAALLAAATAGGEPIVVASGQPVSMVELAHAVIRAAGSHSVIERADRPDPQEDFRADYDLRPARDALGWTPRISLEAGLRSMMGAR